MKILFLLVVFTSLSFNKLHALNIFELSAISAGVYFAYDQFFDSSLSYENKYQKKMSVLQRHKVTSQTKVYPDLRTRSKLVNQLNIIESLHRRNN